MSPVRIGLACSLLLLVPACEPRGEGGPGPSGAPRPEAAREYDLEGTVTAIAEDRKTITIDHGDIPDLMKAMRMEFKVADPKAIEGIQAGDAVKGSLRVSEGSYTVTRLEKKPAR